MKLKLLLLLLTTLTAAAFWAFLHRPAVTRQTNHVDLDQILTKDISDLPEIPDTKAMCDAVGGVWKKIGLSPQEQCNIRTSDGGNGCIDSKACESLCLADLSPEQIDQLNHLQKPIPARGYCAMWRIIVGCHPVVVEGQVPGLVCID